MAFEVEVKLSSVDGVTFVCVDRVKDLLDVVLLVVDPGYAIAIDRRAKAVRWGVG